MAAVKLEVEIDLVRLVLAAVGLMWNVLNVMGKAGFQEVTVHFLLLLSQVHVPTVMRKDA